MADKARSGWVSYGSINPDIEEWLGRSAASHSQMSDSRYRRCVATWRSTFEPLLENPIATKRGRHALDAMRARLPHDLHLFSLPGYRLVSGHEGHLAHGYEITQLHEVDENIANSANVILCDREFHFTCMYTHEWPQFADPVYCDVIDK